MDFFNKIDLGNNSYLNTSHSPTVTNCNGYNVPNLNYNQPTFNNTSNLMTSGYTNLGNPINNGSFKPQNISYGGYVVNTDPMGTNGTVPGSTLYKP